MDYQLTVREENFLIKELRPHIVEYNKNETVLRADDGDETIGYLLDGLLYLCSENEYFERSILHFFRKGEYFTKSMLVRFPDTTSYLITKQKSRAALFSRTELLDFFHENPEWEKRLLMLLSAQSHQGQLSCTCLLHQKSIRTKLMFFLKSESILQSSRTIRLPLPYSDLADYLSVERTALMKELKKMKEEGIVKGANHTLTLL